MEDERPPLPAEKLVELAESKAFRLLLESQAQEAINRVLKRAAWALTPVVVVLGAVGGWIGWSKYTSWQETIARVDARMGSLDATLRQFEDKVRAAQNDIATTERVVQSSRDLVLGAQSGVTAATSLLQRQAQTLSETVAAQAAATQANARAAQADRDAVAAHKASVERDASTVQAAAGVSKEVDDLWKRVSAIQDIQTELTKARSFHMVLLTAHREQTVEVRDPRSLAARPYELTFRSEGLRGEKSPKDSRVRVIAISVDVREPGGQRFTSVLRLEDDSQMREFVCLPGTPFEVVLDFRYSRPLVKDFVALRVRPGDACAATLAAGAK
ncbi:MAG TPA: hypothetical protein VF310_11925 [Vicinamibacteria bacterium]